MPKVSQSREAIASSPIQQTPATTTTTNLFPRVFPNLRVLVFPFRFLGYWMKRKFLKYDADALQARTLLEDVIFAESPRFRASTRDLYFVDMFSRQVIKYSLASAEQVVVYEDPEDFLSGLGWLPDGRLLINSMKKRCVLVYDELAKTTKVYANVQAETRFRANDMVVSTSGRAYLGSFGFNLNDPTALTSSAIASVDMTGVVRVEAAGLVFPNGMVITPNGKTLIVAETFGGRLTAFDIGKEGQLTNSRVWANVGGFVDGICLDAEGCVWTSVVQSGVYPTGGGLLRVQEGGRILQVLGFGANGITKNVFACQLGTDVSGKHQLFFMEAVTNYESTVFKHGVEGAKKNGMVRSIEVSVGPARMADNDAYCGGCC